MLVLQVQLVSSFEEDVGRKDNFMRLLVAYPVLVKNRLLLLQVEVRVGQIQLVLLGEGAEVRPAVIQASHPREKPHEILPLLVCWLLNG